MLCNEIEELEITNEEVKLLLSEINIYKSGGPDNIHPKLLKSLSDNENFVDAITKLFNKCLENIALPNVWKTAIVKM